MITKEAKIKMDMHLGGDEKVGSIGKKVSEVSAPSMTAFIPSLLAGNGCCGWLLCWTGTAFYTSYRSLGGCSRFVNNPSTLVMNHFIPEGLQCGRGNHGADPRSYSTGIQASLFSTNAAPSTLFLQYPKPSKSDQTQSGGDHTR